MHDLRTEQWRQENKFYRSILWCAETMSKFARVWDWDQRLTVVRAVVSALVCGESVLCTVSTVHSTAQYRASEQLEQSVWAQPPWESHRGRDRADSPASSHSGPRTSDLETQSRDQSADTAGIWQLGSVVPRTPASHQVSSFHHRDTVLKCQDWL